MKTRETADLEQRIAALEARDVGEQPRKRR
jgi:hypothetical protein